MIKVFSVLSIFLVGFSTPINEANRWGQIGHRAIGDVAEQHLSEKAATEVKRVLGDESLAKVSTWMDEIRSDDSYDYLETWHYVTIPEGETYDSSEKEERGDIIKGIRTTVEELKSGNLSPEKEAEYLKILVHLVGDIHQPMHVGSKDDRGGNNVRLEWFWENSNLHRVWDSGMINQKQLSFTELADFVNHPTKKEIAQWQNSTVIDWANESQKLLPQAYDIPSDKKLSYVYSYKNWETVELRLLQAGVRLAGVLNEIYS